MKFAVLEVADEMYEEFKQAVLLAKSVPTQSVVDAQSGDVSEVPICSADEWVQKVLPMSYLKSLYQIGKTYEYKMKQPVMESNVIVSIDPSAES